MDNRWKPKRRIQVVIAVMTMAIIMMVPKVVKAADLSPEAIYQIMTSKQTEYYEGRTWTDANSYAWEGGIYSNGMGCAAFAFILSDAAFGTMQARVLADVSFDAIRPGDILRISNDTHYVIVLQKLDDQVVVAEANYNNAVHWGRVITKAELDNPNKSQLNSLNYIITRYPTDPADHQFEVLNRNGNTATIHCWECGLTTTATMPGEVKAYFMGSGDSSYGTKSALLLQIGDCVKYWWYCGYAYSDAAIETEISNGDVATFTNGATKVAGAMGRIEAKGNGTATLTVRNSCDHSLLLSIPITVGGDAELKGKVEISGEYKCGKTLTANLVNCNYPLEALTICWARKDYAYVIGNGQTYVLQDSDLGGMIYCYAIREGQAGNEFIFSQYTPVIVIGDGPAAPMDLIAVEPSSPGAADGQIWGVDSTMEYANNASFGNSVKCTGTSVKGLAAGTYYVRVAATVGAKAGEAAVVVIPSCIQSSGEGNASGTDLKISKKAIRLQDTLAIDFKVPKSAIEGTYQNPYLLVLQNESMHVITEYDVVGDYFVFTYRVAPHMIGEEVTVIPHATGSDGTDVTGSSFRYSVANYCYNMLNKSNYQGEQYASFRKLLVDILIYGDAAQTYVNYKTNELASRNLTSAQRAMGTDVTQIMTYKSVKKSDYANVEAENKLATVSTVALYLESAVNIRYKVEAANAENLRLVITDGTNVLDEMALIGNAKDSQGRYIVDVKRLNANQMKKTVYATVMLGNQKVSNTYRYSIESYAAAKKGMGDVKLENLLDSMMRYGNSAIEYVNGN
ncbi:MAG: hypothetical protein IK081_03440 [Lachnospiraceae bacterium]|nr:hypothetical protein [Lachnospiraceae bacterium]